MSDNRAKISQSLKNKTSPKNFKKNPIKGTKFTVMISSAKGGVGKSTFAINLAFALKKLGKKIGMLDADIHGPSLPKMIGLNEKPKSDGKFLFPLEKYGAQFQARIIKQIGMLQRWLVLIHTKPSTMRVICLVILLG